jgi:hypothetical protein
MLELSKALPQILQQMNLGERLREGRIMDLWPVVVGPDIAARSRATKCRDGLLTVSVASSVWLQQLTMMRLEIVKMFTQRIGPDAVTDIRFTAHGWSEWPVDHTPRSDRPRATGRLDLSGKLAVPQQEHLTSALAQIPDDDLRLRAGRLMAKAELRQQALKAKGWKHCGLCGELHDRPKPMCIVCEVSHP